MTQDKDRTGDRRLNTKQIAAKLGIDPKTWSGYKRRGFKRWPIPPEIPFEDDDGRDRRQPQWWESDIDAWIELRKGPGSWSSLAKADRSS